MNLEILKQLDGKVLDEYEFDELIEHEEVKDWECIGGSGLHVYCLWYDVKLTDGTRLDIYVEV